MRRSGAAGVLQVKTKRSRPRGAATTQWGASISKTFYDVLYSDPNAAQVLGDGNRHKREVTLQAWYEALVSGKPGPKFWQHTWLVGWVHIAANVQNTYMMSNGAKVEEVFLGACLKSFDKDKALQVYTAFKRVFDTVMTVIAESYVQGIISGMESLGLNQKLVERLRKTFIARGIDDMRAALR